MATPGYIDTISLFFACNGIEGKRVTDWMKTKSAKTFLLELSKQKGVEIRGAYNSGALIEFEHGGSKPLFMHPDVAEKYKEYLTTGNFKPDILYVIRMSGSSFYKIGVARNIRERLSSLQSGCPIKLEIVKTFFTTDASIKERKLHSVFDLKRTHGEWFELDESDLQVVESMMNR